MNQFLLKNIFFVCTSTKTKVIKVIEILTQSEKCKASPDAPDPVQDRYRCWNDGTGEKCKDCGLFSDADCIDTQSRVCNTDVCEGVCVWDEWGAWGPCTPECETGLKIRRRTGTEACTDSTIQTGSCVNDFPGVQAFGF